EFWQKKEEFNYKYRQRIYIKNNPSFNFLGTYPSYSIFTDSDFIDFLMKIPFKLRVQRKLFFLFLKKKYPILLKIRGERSFHPIYNQNFIISRLYKYLYKFEKLFNLNIFFKKSHKMVWQWLSNYPAFLNYLKNTFKEDNELFNEILDHRKINDLISKRKWNRSEIYLLFRIITIKKFLDFIKFRSFTKI
ncbi:MAG: hypothetical protein ACTSVV_13275, partial [Promethearchaeota archaeon]